MDGARGGIRNKLSGDGAHKDKEDYSYAPGHGDSRLLEGHEEPPAMTGATAADATAAGATAAAAGDLRSAGNNADWQHGLQCSSYNINNRPGSATSVISETLRPTKLNFGPVGTDEVDSDGGGQKVIADDDGTLPEAAEDADDPAPTGAGMGVIGRSPGFYVAAHSAATGKDEDNAEGALAAYQQGQEWCQGLNSFTMSGFTPGKFPALIGAFASFIYGARQVANDMRESPALLCPTALLTRPHLGASPATFYGGTGGAFGGSPSELGSWDLTPHHAGTASCGGSSSNGRCVRSDGAVEADSGALAQHTQASPEVNIMELLATPAPGSGKPETEDEFESPPEEGGQGVIREPDRTPGDTPVPKRSRNHEAEEYHKSLADTQPTRFGFGEGSNLEQLRGSSTPIGHGTLVGQMPSGAESEDASETLITQMARLRSPTKLGPKEGPPAPQTAQERNNDAPHGSLPNSSSESKEDFYAIIAEEQSKLESH